eukprot:767000-Hanusia_phi.AAC.5
MPPSVSSCAFRMNWRSFSRSIQSIRPRIASAERFHHLLTSQRGRFMEMRQDDVIDNIHTGMVNAWIEEWEHYSKTKNGRWHGWNIQSTHE